MVGNLPAGAKRDVAEIVTRYSAEAGPQVAQDFVVAFAKAIDHIREHPQSGSLRFVGLTGIEGLRVWPVHGFPHLVFYRIEPTGPAILAVLHTSRDIPASLRP